MQLQPEQLSAFRFAPFVYELCLLTPAQPDPTRRILSGLVHKSLAFLFPVYPALFSPRLGLTYEGEKSIQEGLASELRRYKSIPISNPFSDEEDLTLYEETTFYKVFECAKRNFNALIALQDPNAESNASIVMGTEQARTFALKHLDEVVKKERAPEPTLQDLQTSLRTRQPLLLKEHQRAKLLEDVKSLRQASGDATYFDYAFGSTDPKNTQTYPCNGARLFLEIPQRLEATSQSYNLLDSVPFQMNAEQLELFSHYLNGSLHNPTVDQIFALGHAALDNNLFYLTGFCQAFLLQALQNGLAVNGEQICEFLHLARHNIYLQMACFKKVEALTEGEMVFKWDQEMEEFALTLKHYPEAGHLTLFEEVLPYVSHLRTPDLSLLRGFLDHWPANKPLESIKVLDMPCGLSHDEIRTLLNLFPNVELIYLYNVADTSYLQQGIFGRRAVWFEDLRRVFTIPEISVPGDTFFVLENGGYDAGRRNVITDRLYKKIGRDHMENGTSITERFIPRLAGNYLSLVACPKINWLALKFKAVRQLDLRNNPGLPRVFLERLLKRFPRCRLSFSASETLTEAFFKELSKAYPYAQMTFEIGPNKTLEASGRGPS